MAANPLWYHTLELAPGVVTPGWFDLRPIADRLPWPDVRGKRCLDIGTYDGFLAFELERRGAAEVVATDIADHESWDWPPHMRGRTAAMAEIAGPEKGLGFRLAKEALGSRAERIEISIYDLSPERIGQFDVVVCGTLLLHLRDPLRALEAARSVCASRFMSIEEIRPELTARHLRLPVAELNGVDDLCQWWIPNLAGHRRMVQASGFEIERTIPPYATPLGRGHSPLGRSWDARKARALTWLLTRRRGILTSALLARPRTS